MTNDHQAYDLDYICPHGIGGVGCCASCLQDETDAMVENKVKQATEPLQQAYDRAMAHNAMLREALTTFNPLTGSPCNYSKRQQAINATEADVTAWEKKLRQEVMLAVHPLQPEYEKLQQQLATATQERDALRRELSKYGGDAMYRNGVCFVKKVD